MKHPSLLAGVAFLAGLCIGYFTRIGIVGTLQRRGARAADLAAIEKLHKADIAATLTQDPSSLTNLFSDDAVNLVFPAPVVGIKAMKEAFEKFRADYPDFQVLKYAPDTKDVQFVDGWAIEVISGESTYKTSAKDNPVTVAGKSMRVLKRQSDGSWKFALVGLK
jgi:uncharacterized protein (TIGR02246 family)